MSRTLTFKTGIIISLLIMSYAIAFGSVFAHGDEEHEDVHHAEASEMNVGEMEQMVKLLQQLVALLTQYKAQYGTYVAPIPTYVTPAVPVAPTAHDEHEDKEEHEHAEEHAEETPVATLVIEVETHSGKTHVHVRYTDKPEEMFFVDTTLSNESGVVADIAARTGLAADAVKAALKYTGMNN